jgi:phage shock protein PspC (stress-responsive transcriptional regulator)
MLAVQIGQPDQPLAGIPGGTHDEVSQPVFLVGQSVIANYGRRMVQPQTPPPVMKRSRAKIWIRTGILAVFGTLFGLALYHDIESGSIRFWWALVIFLPAVPFGFWMRTLVPMQVHAGSRSVTLSFDRIYFALIVVLVILKAVAGSIMHVTIVADGAMCLILGLMTGRLSGICLRVRDLKLQMRSIDE